MDHGSKTEVPPSEWVQELDGVLHAEGVSLPALAARFGTPLHVYSAAEITRAFHAVDAALAGLPHTVCYAMKANGSPAILRLLASLGAGRFERFATGIADLYDVAIERAREILGLLDDPAQRQPAFPGAALLHFAAGPACACA